MHRIYLALPLVLAAFSACVPSAPIPTAPDPSLPVRPEPAPDPELTYCVQLNPRETSDEEKVVFPGEWFVTAKKLYPGGRVGDQVIGSSQTNYMGLTTLCVSKSALTSPILLTATHSVLPSTPFTLRRLLTPPAKPIPPAANVQAAPLTMDILTTHLTDIIMDIYELPFSGSVISVSQEEFSAAEAALRSDSSLNDGLEEFTLTQAEVREAWNDNIKDLSALGQARACLSTPFPTHGLGGGGTYTFPGAAPEAFPKGVEADKPNFYLDTSLDTDGSLFELAGIELDDMTVTVNGVNLNTEFSTFRKVAGDLSGAVMTATDFDPTGNLNAEFSMVNVHNAWDEDVIVPCVVGFLKVTNHDGDDDSIDSGSSICVDAVGAGSLFQIPSNGALGDAPDRDTRFMVFGDDGDGNAWVLGAPGISRGDQKDPLAMSVNGENVCVEFYDNQDLGSDSDDDTATAYWFLCAVEGGNETLASSRVNSSGRGFFDVGTHPAHFNDAGLDEREIAGQIGRSDFAFNPAVVTFMDSEYQESLINGFGGHQPNAFFSGFGLNAEYGVTLNGSGPTLAKIFTGPEGQWSGGIQFDNSALGGFLRFSADDSALQSGHYFDVPITESCMPGAPPPPAN